MDTNKTNSEETFLPYRSSFIFDYTPILKRRYLYATCASLTAISLFGLLFFTLWAEQPTINPIADDLIPLNASLFPVSDRLGPGDNLIGPPTSRFRGLVYPPCL